jgi:hypothetical protein
MTLMKSLLLGSAAGIVAVASAQAADLPTKKGAPAAEYVKICSITVAGKPIVGFTLPGSDTCLKISGYLTAHVEGGNLKEADRVDYSYYDSPQYKSGTFGRASLGFNTRLNLTLDLVSNTSYGPLAGHVELQSDYGSGYDSPGSASAAGASTYVNRAYVTWAGLTAGRANSFFSSTGGGAAWNNIFSADQQGFNQPDVLAYTASFGGGFSATLAAQSPAQAINYSTATIAHTSGSGSGPYNFAYNGTRVPDIVGSLDLAQGWGSAHVAGVAHYVDVNTETGGSGASQKVWGWAVDAGLSFNLPSFGAGDTVEFQASYSRNATLYSGLADAMNGENGAVNGNGQAMALADTYYTYDGEFWQTPTAWSVSGEIDHHFSPQWVGSLEGAYGEINWSGNGGYESMVSNSRSYIVGAVAHWDPLGTPALDFSFELLYQNTHTDQPSGYYTSTGSSYTSSW